MEQKNKDLGDGEGKKTMKGILQAYLMIHLEQQQETFHLTLYSLLSSSLK